MKKAKTPVGVDDGAADLEERVTEGGRVHEGGCDCGHGADDVALVDLLRQATLAPASKCNAAT